MREAFGLVTNHSAVIMVVVNSAVIIVVVNWAGVMVAVNWGKIGHPSMSFARTVCEWARW